MDYDWRINRLETVIGWMESENSVTHYNLTSIHSTHWKNSYAKVAAEESFARLDTYLSNYQAAYEDCLEALRNRKLQLENTKLELYHYYKRELSSLSAEDRTNYLNKTDIDPSVKKMLGW